MDEIEKRIKHQAVPRPSPELDRRIDQLLEESEPSPPTPRTRRRFSLATLASTGVLAASVGIGIGLGIGQAEFLQRWRPPPVETASPGRSELPPLRVVLHERGVSESLNFADLREPFLQSPSAVLSRVDSSSESNRGSSLSP